MSKKKVTDMIGMVDGHVPFIWKKLAAKLLQFQNYHIHVVVTGKSINRGAGFGLDKCVQCILYFKTPE